jgi:hypothetical protein
VRPGAYLRVDRMQSKHMYEFIIFRANRSVKAKTLTEMGWLSTIDLLIKVAHFEIKANNIFNIIMS